MICEALIYNVVLDHFLWICFTFEEYCVPMPYAFSPEKLGYTIGTKAGMVSDGWIKKLLRPNPNKRIYTNKSLSSLPLQVTMSNKTWPLCTSIDRFPLPQHLDLSSYITRFLFLIKWLVTSFLNIRIICYGLLTCTTKIIRKERNVSMLGCKLFCMPIPHVILRVNHVLFASLGCVQKTDEL